MRDTPKFEWPAEDFSPIPFAVYHDPEERHHPRRVRRGESCVKG